MDPELTINLEVNEMNVDKTKNIDKIQDVHKITDKPEKDLNKTEDGDKIVDNTIDKIEKVDKSVTLDNVMKLNADSSFTSAIKEMKRRSDMISKKKALVEKKSSKFKIWFLRTFFFRKSNKSKTDLKRRRHDLTVTESGVQRSASPSPSTSSSVMAPRNDIIPEENVESPIVLCPLVSERGIKE